MELSPLVRASTKRFAWLWGALLGAVLLPSLMVGSYMATRQVLIGATLVSWSRSVLLPALSMVKSQYRLAPVASPKPRQVAKSVRKKVRMAG
jgi:hypothetical protein